MRHFHLIGLSILILTGCNQPPSKAILEEYGHRLMNVLDKPTIDFQHADTPSLPGVRELSQNTTTFKISLLEAISFRTCGLDQLIGEKNSSLGKVYTPSQRFIYEASFIQAATQCLNVYPPADKKYQLLHPIVEKKKQEIHLHFQNMMLTDKGLYHLWFSGMNEIQPGKEAGADRSLWVDSMMFFIEQSKAIEKGKIQHISIHTIEQQISNMSHSAFLPSLMTSLRKSAHILHQINQSLIQHQEIAYCRKGQKPRKHQLYLQNVFRKFYIGQVQPYLAQLDRLSYMTHPYIEAVYLQAGIPEPFQDYVQNIFIHPDSHERKLRQEAKKHVTWWQGFFQSCNLTPM